LQVFLADAVVNAVQPGFQVREHQMDDRHELFRNLGVAALCNRVMIVAVSPQPVVTAPIVGNDVTARLLPRSLRLDAADDVGVDDEAFEELVPLSR
jgi:DNA-directed RNA polymerase subunit N (RpoN/RPB10)